MYMTYQAVYLNNQSIVVYSTSEGLHRATQLGSDSLY